MSSVQIRCDRNVNGREIDEGRREEEIFLDINSSTRVKIVLHRSYCVVWVCDASVNRSHPMTQEDMNPSPGAPSTRPMQ